MSTGFYNVRRNSVFSAVFFRAVRKIETDWSIDPQQSNRVHPNKYSLGNSPRWRRPKKDRKLSKTVFSRRHHLYRQIKIDGAERDAFDFPAALHNWKTCKDRRLYESSYFK